MTGLTIEELEELLTEAFEDVYWIGTVDLEGWN